jgi:hypothetical protein
MELNNLASLDFKKTALQQADVHEESLSLHRGKGGPMIYR